MILSLPALQEQFRLQITGVIQAGAHQGQEVPIWEPYNVPMVLFEPVKENYQILKAKTKGVKKLKTYNVALGAQEGEGQIHIDSGNSGQSSSLLTPKRHLKQYPFITFPHKEKVKIKTLDSYNLTGYNLLSMDVQGYELELLKGATQTLTQIDYIISEVNRGDLYENNAMVGDLDTFLQGYGFRRYLTSWAGGTWGDAFYCKTRKE